jgi:hypothetical protein
MTSTHVPDSGVSLLALNLADVRQAEQRFIDEENPIVEHHVDEPARLTMCLYVYVSMSSCMEIHM